MEMSKIFKTMTYIKKEWKENIRNYKYNAKDESIVYNYIASPICDKFVNYLPAYIA